MNSKNRNLSTSLDLLTFDENWCKAVLEKARKEAKKEDGKDVKEKASSISMGRSPGKDLLPAPCQLRQLISILFYASLETEEGDHPQISVIWLPSSSTEANRMIRFSEPRWLNDRNKRSNTGQLALPSQELRKFSALCHSEEILLLIEPCGSSDGELVAWGILDLRHPLTTKANNPEDLLELSTYPEALSVHFDRPGSLVVKWSGKYLKEFPGDDEPTPIADLQLIKTRCEESGSRNFGGIVGFDHEPTGHWNIKDNPRTWEVLYENAQILVVESMMGKLVKRRIGGTFLFTAGEPDNDQFKREKLHIYKETGTLIFQPQSIKEEIRRWIDNNIIMKCSTYHIFADSSIRYRLRMVADWLANFATVDGSVILSRSLCLLAFAVKTNARQIDKNDIDEDTSVWLKNHGTRHSSAANWVGDDPSQERFALVVSQDGHANAIYWKGGKVRRSAVVYRCL